MEDHREGVLRKNIEIRNTRNQCLIYQPEIPTRRRNTMSKVTTKTLIAALVTAVLAVGFAVPGVFAQCPAGQIPVFDDADECILDPATIDKYYIPLVIPPVMNNTGIVDSYDIAVRQFTQQILPGGIWATLGAAPTTAFPATTVWSYGPAPVTQLLDLRIDELSGSFIHL